MKKKLTWWLNSGQAAQFTTEYDTVLSTAQSLNYQEPSASIQTAQNAFLSALKTNGIWDLLDCLWVFAGDGDADFASLNWKNPGTYTCQRNGATLVYNGLTGFETTEWSDLNYINTQFTPSANGVNYTQNDAGLGGYFIMTPPVSDEYSLYGAYSNGASPFTSLLYSDFGDPFLYSAINSNNAGLEASLTGVNFSTGVLLHAQRLTGTSRLYINATSKQNATDTNGGRTSNQIYILASNNGVGSTSAGIAECYMFFIGANLTGKESALNTAWNNYLASL